MAIKTFTDATTLPASDINTYLANAGLVYVTSQTVGTGVSSVTVSNAFNSTYDNYLITWTGGTASGTADIGVRIGSATTNYYGFLTYGAYNSATVSGANDNNQSMFRYIGGADGFYSSVTFNVFRPYAAAVTTITSQNNLGGSNFGSYAGRLADLDSHSSFTLLHTLGTATLTGGTITVYGYRKA